MEKNRIEIREFLLREIMKFVLHCPSCKYKMEENEKIVGLYCSDDVEKSVERIMGEIWKRVSP